MLGEADWKTALTWMILPVGRTWYRAISRAFTDFGMSFSTAAPILAVATLGEGLRQNVIADAIGVDTAALVRSLDRLEALNLVERRIDPDDRRGRTLYLTEQGQKLADDLEALAESIRKHVLASITDGDGQATVRALQSLQKAAEEMVRNEKQE